MVRQLVKANAGDRVEILDEVSRLLTGIRGAWLQMPPEARNARRAR